MFAFCESATSHAIYGDGFFWSGSVIAYLLGQRKRYEALDFSSHLKFLTEYAEIKTPAMTQQNAKNPLKNFLLNFGQSVHVTTEIFAILNMYEDDLKIVKKTDNNPCGVELVDFVPERGAAETGPPTTSATIPGAGLKPLDSTPISLSVPPMIPTAATPTLTAPQNQHTSAPEPPKQQSKASIAQSHTSLPPVLPQHHQPPPSFAPSSPTPLANDVPALDTFNISTSTKRRKSGSSHNAPVYQPPGALPHHSGPDYAAPKPKDVEKPSGLNPFASPTAGKATDHGKEETRDLMSWLEDGHNKDQKSKDVPSSTNPFAQPPSTHTRISPNISPLPSSSLAPFPPTPTPTSPPTVATRAPAPPIPTANTISLPIAAPERTSSARNTANFGKSYSSESPLTRSDSTLTPPPAVRGQPVTPNSSRGAPPLPSHTPTLPSQVTQVPPLSPHTTQAPLLPSQSFTTNLPLPVSAQSHATALPLPVPTQSYTSPRPPTQTTDRRAPAPNPTGFTINGPAPTPASSSGRPSPKIPTQVPKYPTIGPAPAAPSRSTEFNPRGAAETAPIAPVRKYQSMKPTDTSPTPIPPVLTAVTTSLPAMPPPHVTTPSQSVSGNVDFDNIFENLSTSTPRTTGGPSLPPQQNQWK